MIQNLNIFVAFVVLFYMQCDFKYKIRELQTKDVQRQSETMVQEYMSGKLDFVKKITSVRCTNGST
jgi:hypothetical protein